MRTKSRPSSPASPTWFSPRCQSNSPLRLPYLFRLRDRAPVPFLAPPPGEDHSLGRSAVRPALLIRFIGGLLKRPPENVPVSFRSRIHTVNFVARLVSGRIGSDIPYGYRGDSALNPLSALRMSELPLSGCLGSGRRLR